MEITFNSSFSDTLQRGLHLATLGLPLQLQLGELRRLNDPENAFWTRQATYQPVDDPDTTYPRVLAQIARLRTAVAANEPLRVWWSDQPDDRLGMMWLCAVLQGVAIPLTQIRVPLMQPTPEGNRQERTDLSEVAPGELATYLSLDCPMTDGQRQAATYGWRSQLAANAELRVNLNGHILGVPANFYDDFLKTQWLPTVEATAVIGETLGRFPVGVPEWWYRYRLATLRQAGDLA